MNVVALFAHCFTTPHSALWAELWACDVVFTSCSALSAALGFAANMQFFDDRRPSGHAVLLGGAVAIISAGATLQPLSGWEYQFAFEQLYLQAVVVAACAGILRLTTLIYSLSTPICQPAALVTLASATLVLVMAVVMCCAERWLVAMAGEVLSAPVVMFLGCDLIFILLYFHFEGSLGSPAYHEREILDKKSQ